ncbi:hypothetical protein KA012_04465 [Candidatus Woesebacteria bacterium]|nr:hypothetical protein [Candidatus Woesebacteria bacterium]
MQTHLNQWLKKNKHPVGSQAGILSSDQVISPASPLRGIVIDGAGLVHSAQTAEALRGHHRGTAARVTSLDVATSQRDQYATRQPTPQEVIPLFGDSGISAELLKPFDGLQAKISFQIADIDRAATLWDMPPSKSQTEQYKDQWVQLIESVLSALNLIGENAQPHGRAHGSGVKILLGVDGAMKALWNERCVEKIADKKSGIFQYIKDRVLAEVGIREGLRRVHGANCKESTKNTYDKHLLIELPAISVVLELSAQRKKLGKIGAGRGNLTESQNYRFRDMFAVHSEKPMALFELEYDPKEISRLVHMHTGLPTPELLNLLQTLEY